MSGVDTDIRVPTGPTRNGANGPGPVSGNLLRAVRKPMVHDARVAALCIAHGVTELWTADRDFGRFPGLAARNPLLG